MNDPVVIGDATFYQGDVLECLAELPDNSVHCCVTSPPYWGLRDYGTAKWEGGNPECDHKTGRSTRPNYSEKQATNIGADDNEAVKNGGTCPKCGAIKHDDMIGLEPTFQEWLDKMVEVCREVRRVLRKDGTFWLNCGDAYASNNSNNPNTVEQEMDNRKRANEKGYSSPAFNITTGWNRNTGGIPQGFKPKDLLMMPARLAIALQADGWWLRSEIIWAKPNPMPESVTDRPTSAHEKIYLLTKSAKYFYDADAVREAAQYGYREMPDGDFQSHCQGRVSGTTKGCNPESGRNLRNVWTIATQPYPEAHFATFPEAIPMKCIMAGTSERGCCPECGKPWERVTEKELSPTRAVNSRTPPGQSKHATFSELRRDEPIQYHTLGFQPACDCGGDPIPCTVLDPFSGAATTGLVALKLERRYIGIELNPDYVAMSIKRIEMEARQEKLFK